MISCSALPHLTRCVTISLLAAPVPPPVLQPSDLRRSPSTGTIHPGLQRLRCQATATPGHDNSGCLGSGFSASLLPILLSPSLHQAAPQSNPAQPGKAHQRLDRGWRDIAARDWLAPIDLEKPSHAVESFNERDSLSRKQKNSRSN